MPGPSLNRSHVAKARAISANPVIRFGRNTDTGECGTVEQREYGVSELDKIISMLRTGNTPLGTIRERLWFLLDTLKFQAEITEREVPPDVSAHIRQIFPAGEKKNTAEVLNLARFMMSERGKALPKEYVQLRGEWNGCPEERMVVKMAEGRYLYAVLYLSSNRDSILGKHFELYEQEKPTYRPTQGGGTIIAKPAHIRCIYRSRHRLDTEAASSDDATSMGLLESFYHQFLWRS